MNVRMSTISKTYRRSAAWSTEDEDFLREHFMALNDDELGQRLNRTAGSVMNRRNVLGLNRQVLHTDRIDLGAASSLRKPPTLEEIEQRKLQVQQQWSEREKANRIADGRFRSGEFEIRNERLSLVPISADDC